MRFHRVCADAFLILPGPHPDKTKAIIWGSVIALIALFLPGCGDPKQPKAVWCETGTGPSQVVYPRAISYDPKDDTFFIIDRMARVQHLDHNGQFLHGLGYAGTEDRQACWRVGGAGWQCVCAGHALPPDCGLFA